jgi:phenylpropionate dioxygenase-like ring-hydroxylating dioxygenase large terminal subunit
MIDDPVLVNDWHPVARSDALKEGVVQGARLLGEDIVLWSSPGQVHAWKDLCIHRGTRLSLGRVEEDCLICPYHGWTYDESGKCTRIPAHPDQVPPARARVQTYTAKERYGLVWVSLGEPDQDVPPFPEEDESAYRKILSGPFPQVHASAPRLIENFLDIAHFPFVHTGKLGDPGRPEVRDYTAEVGPEGIVARDVVFYQPDPYGTGVGDDISYTYRVFRPLTAYLVKETKEGTRLSILFIITPHDETTSTPWFYMATSQDDVMTEEEIEQYHGSILAEDVPIVESQRPELLPLDLQAELHLRSDRTAIAYRKWLNELGLSFGTS